MDIFKNIFLYTIFIPLVGSFVPHASTQLNLKTDIKYYRWSKQNFFLVDFFFQKRKKEKRK